MKRIKTILAAVLVLALMAATTAPLAVRAETSDDNIVITIFHTNDMHGRFVRGMEFNAHAETIGVQYIASIMAATENAILLDAGDTLHGTPFSVFSGGLDPVRLMNAAGYNFMAPGNHDFNFGLNRLLELEGYADFGILAANVFWNDTNELVFTPYAVSEIAGIRFGFFGLVTQSTPEVTHPNNIAEINFGCPVEAAELSVAALQALEVDVIVGISHIGTGPINEVTAAVDGINLIVDGHSHSLHGEGAWVNDTLIVQALDHGRRLGQVTLTFDAEGALLGLEATILSFNDDIDGNFDACPVMLELIAEIEAAFDEQTREIVAYTPVTLEHTHTLIRSYEMPLGNLVADAFQWASGADIALMNGGAIRDVIEAGDITVGDMLRVLPFINYLVIVEMTPAIIFDALENGVSRWPTESGNGRFLQVAGLFYTFDAFAEVGERILSVVVDGVELDRNDTTTIFTVAITDFKANGGDGFDMFEDLVVVYEGDVKSMVFIDFLNSDDADIAGASVEGRILQVGTEPVEEEIEEEEIEEEIVVEEIVEEIIEEIVEEEVEEEIVDEVVGLHIPANFVASNGAPISQVYAGQTWINLRGLAEYLGGVALSTRNEDGERVAHFVLYDSVIVTIVGSYPNIQVAQSNATAFRNVNDSWFITLDVLVELLGVELVLV